MTTNKLLEALRSANEHIGLLKLELTRAENRAEDLQRELDHARSI